MIAFWRRSGAQTRVAMLTLVALALGALLVPALANTDPLAIGDALALRLLPPLSFDVTRHFHLLGTDSFGRDLFVRVMLAGRLSLAVGLAGSAARGRCRDRDRRDRRMGRRDYRSRRDGCSATRCSRYRAS